MFLLLAVAVAGCGPLPKPFKTDPGQGIESPIDAIKDSAGVVVAPIEDAPSASAGPLADLLAAKLADKGIPATTGAALKDAYLLEGTAASPAADGTLAINWTLSDDKGAVIASFSTHHGVSPGAWQAGTQAQLKTIASSAAEAISHTLLGPAMVARAVSKPSRPAIAVVSVEGAPGDGDRSLKTAFEAVLRRAGLPVVADPAKAAVRIYGKVEVAPGKGGSDGISIKWTLRDSKDKELGVLTQSNKVPGGSLDSDWGPVAYDITTAMISGVKQVLQVMDKVEDIRHP